jgi:hypothetical protein
LGLRGARVQIGARDRSRFSPGVGGKGRVTVCGRGCRSTTTSVGRATVRVAVTTAGTNTTTTGSATTTRAATTATTTSAPARFAPLSSRCGILSLSLMCGGFFVLFAGNSTPLYRVA